MIILSNTKYIPVTLIPWQLLFFMTNWLFNVEITTLVLSNGSSNWSVNKYIKDKDGTILYSSKFFIPTIEEDYNCSKDIKELKSIIKAQQEIIDKLSYQVKRLSS